MVFLQNIANFFNPTDPLHKWRLNLNSNTLSILSFVLMFLHINVRLRSYKYCYYTRRHLCNGSMVLHFVLCHFRGEGTCGFENVISAGKLIVNESDEGRRASDETALCKAYAV